ncbi:MAG: hypothetical protein L0099_04225 [Acidobacteria bacterium]|nr:hypothetical protein [Acidobacteriota bacterium]
MSARATSVQLLPMACLRCAAPIPAEETEIAWVCEKCGQGMQLTRAGLSLLTVQWAAAKTRATNPRWEPFWSFVGAVRFTQRFNFGGRSEPDKLWAEPQRFFIPAYQLPLRDLETIGAELLKKRLRPTPGPAVGKLAHCSLFPADAKQAAEFVVLTIEAERRDKLKTVAFTIETDEPELWMLPFVGEPSPQNLALT